MHGIDLERSWTFFDASGNKFWSGLLRTGQVVEIVNGEASTTIAAGEAVIALAAGSAWPRWDLAATSDPIKAVNAGRRVQAATSQGFIGVALENIAVGKVGRVGGRGTWTAVKSLTAASLGSNTLGACVTGSATPGSVDAVANTTTVNGRVLGIVLMIAGATGPGTDSGSLTQLGIDVNPQ